MAKFGDSEAQKVIYEIETYLVNHPKAADTIEGISKWWMPPGEEASKLLVQQAIDYLVANSVVKSSTHINGNKVYSKINLK